MKKLMLGFVMLFSITMLPSAANAQANTNQQVADEIIAMVKAQWAAETADPSNSAEIFKTLADDYTEFNPSYSTRLDGKTVVINLAEPSGTSRRVASEMLNTKVQVYGDVAILSYNFAGVRKNKDGELKPWRAKSTRVYAKQSGKWKLVHGNFGADPLSEN